MKRTLKNLLAGFCLAVTSVAVTTPALADDDFDIYGRVKSKTSNSIVVNSNGRTIKVQVTPMTKIEAEYHRGGDDYDRRISLSNIRVGEPVKIEAYRRGNQYVAEDIEVRR